MGMVCDKSSCRSMSETTDSFLQSNGVLLSGSITLTQ